MIDVPHCPSELQMQPARPISQDEVDRAIYFDFEGLADEPPALIGLLDGGVLEQVVLRTELASAAETSALRVSSLATELESMVARCEAENRVLVAFTSHEANVATEHAGIEIGTYYRDAHKIAKRWRSRCLPPDTPRDNSLADFLRLIGYRPPRHLGLQNSAHGSETWKLS